MRFIYILIAVSCACAGLSQAESIEGKDLSDAEDIVQDMSTKLNRGIFNILTGWMEIPRQMIKSGKETGWWAVVPVGIPAGALMTVVRTGVGIFETGLFFVPIDDTYDPLLDPPFVWQKASE